MGEKVMGLRDKLNRESSKSPVGSDHKRLSDPDPVHALRGLFSNRIAQLMSPESRYQDSLHGNYCGVAERASE